MTKNSVFYFTSILFLQCIAAVSSHACVLSLRVNEFRPFIYKQESQLHTHWKGLDIEMAAALLSEAGCDFKPIEVPWVRGINMLESGDVDIMMNLSRTAQRKRFAHFIGPYRYESIHLITPEGTEINYQSLRDFYRLPGKVALQSGIYYGDEFNELYQSDPGFKARFLIVTSLIENQRIAMMNRGRISGFLELKLHALYQKKENPMFEYTQMAATPVNTTPTYFAFSKLSVNQTQMDKLTQAYQRLLSQKKLAQIEAKYLHALEN